MSDEEDYLKAIDIYFSLKNSYETKIKNEKKNMKKKAINQKDYLNLFKGYQPKCVNCKAYGGTIFNTTKEYYLAECNAEKKCNLNIKIKKGQFLTTDDYSHEIQKELNEIKTNIIKNKLNLLFKLDKEDIILEEFDKLKESFKVSNEKDKLVKMYNDKNLKVQWVNYMNFYEKESKNEGEKKGEDDEMKTTRDLAGKSISKEELIKIVERKIDLDIRNFNNFLKDYKNDPQKNKSKLRTALSLYIENIRPNTDKLFSLKYEEFIIEEKNKGGGGFGKKPEIEYIFKLKKKSHENNELELEKPIVENLHFNQKIVEKAIKSMARGKKQKVKGKKGMTITFSSSVENHVGMTRHGDMVDGYSVIDLENSYRTIMKMFPDSNVELIDLLQALPESERGDAEPAKVLVWRDGVNKILSAIKKTSIDLFKEHDALEKDTTYYDTRRKKVLNKNARHNLCFADEGIAPNIAEKQGTVVAFEHVPLTKYIRDALPELFGEKARNKNAEGNYYYDLNKTGIGFHGDSERRDVIGIRAGEDETSGFPIHYQWFYKSNPIGDRTIIELTNKDIYVMSEKAVGTDWKTRNTKTLRHAAGGKNTKYLNISRKVSPIKEEKSDTTSGEAKQKTVTSMFESVSSKQSDTNRPDLHNETDVFKFYKKSKDDVPGKGTAAGGEKVEDATKYEELASISNWRKALSNMYVKKDADGNILPLFKLDGYNWASVEHWYHAGKYKYKIADDAYKKFYEGFTFESNSLYSRDPVLALSVGGKRGTLNKKKFRPSNVVMDPNFEKIKVRVMKDGQRAKYTQDEFCKKVLLATKRAKLVHIAPRRGKPSVLVPFISTMEIRESFKNNIEINLEEGEVEEGEVEEGEVEEKVLKTDDIQINLK